MGTCTVDSNVDEMVVSKTYQLIQVIGDLYQVIYMYTLNYL